MASQPQLRAVGVSWYTSENYDALRALMVDAHLLAETYERFLRSAEKFEEQARRSGLAVIRVHLDAHDFPAFCRERGLDLDAKGRTAYAAYVAARMVKEQGRGEA